MPNEVIAVEIKAVIPASGGCAVFLGNDAKMFVIYIDQMVGAAITMFMRGTRKERPLTHDLILNILLAYGARLDRVVINDFHEGIYFARIVLSADNELHQKKIMEIDARPSDSLALATGLKAPIYVSRKVWDEASDDSHVLRSMQERGRAGMEGPVDPDDEDEPGFA